MATWAAGAAAWEAPVPISIPPVLSGHTACACPPLHVVEENEIHPSVPAFWYPKAGRRGGTVDPVRLVGTRVPMPLFLGFLEITGVG